MKSAVLIPALRPQNRTWGKKKREKNGDLVKVTRVGEHSQEQNPGSLDLQLPGSPQGLLVRVTQRLNQRPRLP